MIVHKGKDVLAAQKCLAGGETSYTYEADAGETFVSCFHSAFILFLVSKTWSASYNDKYSTESWVVCSFTSQEILQ